MCCSHFSWYCFIFFTIFFAPFFPPLIHWFFSLSSFVIPSKCLKIFICAASKRCSSLFFSTQALLPKFQYCFSSISVHVSIAIDTLCVLKTVFFFSFYLIIVTHCPISTGKSVSSYIYMWISVSFFLERISTYVDVLKFLSFVLLVVGWVWKRILVKLFVFLPFGCALQNAEVTGSMLGAQSEGSWCRFGAC